MGRRHFEIKDDCREKLSEYTVQAFRSLPRLERPLVLDLGCGTGVPTLALMRICDGEFYALDSDDEALDRLEEKARSLGLDNRITTVHDSVFHTPMKGLRFNVVLAEGLLNIIGFEKGLHLLRANLKEDGFIIIHDEYKDDREKRSLFETENLKLLDSIFLDETVWWNDYYDCLSRKIENENDRTPFQNEAREIEQYRKDPLSFVSIYYILQGQTRAQ